MHMYVFKKQGHTVVRGPPSLSVFEYVLISFSFFFFFLTFGGEMLSK